MCARGRDWLESVALLLSDRVDVMALGGAKISMMYLNQIVRETSIVFCLFVWFLNVLVNY